MPLIRWEIRMAYDDAQKIKTLQEIQDMSRTPKKYDDLQYLAMMKQRKSPIPVFVPEQPVVNRARGGGDLPSSQPIMPIMEQQVQTAPDKKTKVGQILNKPISDKEGNPTDLVTEITEAYIDMMPPSEKGKPSLEKMLPKENVVVANMLNQSIILLIITLLFILTIFISKKIGKFIGVIFIVLLGFYFMRTGISFMENQNEGNNEIPLEDDDEPIESEEI